MKKETLKGGDKVKTPEGIETVMNANGVQIITEESERQGNWWHPSKLVLLQKGGRT